MKVKFYMYLTYLQDSRPLLYVTLLVQMSVCGSSSTLTLGVVGFQVSIANTVPFPYRLHPNTSAWFWNTTYTYNYLVWSLAL